MIIKPRVDDVIEGCLFFNLDLIEVNKPDKFIGFGRYNGSYVEVDQIDIELSHDQLEVLGWRLLDNCVSGVIKL
jgi:hypothetical protein